MMEVVGDHGDGKFLDIGIGRESKGNGEEPIADRIQPQNVFSGSETWDRELTGGRGDDANFCSKHRDLHLSQCFSAKRIRNFAPDLSRTTGDGCEDEKGTKKKTHKSLRSRAGAGTEYTLAATAGFGTAGFEQQIWARL